jgi:hypothetical protein
MYHDFSLYLNDEFLQQLSCSNNLSLIEHAGLIFSSPLLRKLVIKSQAEILPERARNKSKQRKFLLVTPIWARAAAFSFPADANAQNFTLGGVAPIMKRERLGAGAVIRFGLCTGSLLRTTLAGLLQIN